MWRIADLFTRCWIEYASCLNVSVKTVLGDCIYILVDVLGNVGNWVVSFRCGLRVFELVR